MTIPALSTTDKSFICSYSMGANVDFRLASGIMNEITTYTTEYIDGKCWIPVFAPTETNDQSNFWDEPEKDVVYVKVGCRISSDGYIHTWLLDIQKVSELILWNSKASACGTPPNDTTVLHWTIEKLYRQVWGSTSGFISSNIKFQIYNYTSGTRIYLFGSNTASTNPVCSMDPANVVSSTIGWYPNNTIVNISDLLTYTGSGSSPKCTLGGASDGRLGISTVAMGTSPLFWYMTCGHSSSASISSVCVPGDAGFKTESLCVANTVSLEGIGNNSGRSYTVHPTGSKCIGCSDDHSHSSISINLSPNQAYIWVDSYCRGASGDGPTECAANGGTWIPGHYECDPAFTYDSSVSFEYCKWNSISYTIGDFAAGRFYFASLDDGYTHYMMAQYTTTSFIDMFSEYEDEDIDYVKHFNFSPYVHITDPPTLPPYNNTFYAEYACMLGIGIVTNTSGLTISTSDWIVTWGGNNYFNSWQTPDALGARSPGSTQTLINGPLTHHDSFNTSGIDIEGGFLYEPSPSNGFLSRTIDNETKINIPLCHNTEFCWRYIPTTSNGFLIRSIDVELKINTPLINNTGFEWIYQPMISNAFLSRTIDNETKTNSPLCRNYGFCWVYDLEEPWVSKHRFLKIDGNDADDGLTFATAWETFSYAMTNVNEDGRLYVGEGIYTESVDMSPQKGFELFLMDIAGDDAPAEVIITPV